MSRVLSNLTGVSQDRSAGVTPWAPRVRLNAMRRLSLIIAAAALLLASPGCDLPGGSEGSCLDPGQVTIGPEQGADLCTGEVLPGSHATDIWAVEDGGKLAFMTGGETSTHPRPVNWFTPGGYQKTFDGLDDVPAEYPDDVDGFTLKKAKEHGGFLLLRADDTWVKGWFAALSATSATIVFGPVVEDAGTSNP
jgi:hypothetical protein